MTKTFTCSMQKKKESFAKKSEGVEALKDKVVSDGTLKSEDLIPKFLGVLKTYGKDKWSSLAAEMDIIFGEFAVCMKNGTAPDGEETQSLVRRLQNHITENYYHCTGEILTGLGQMYVADERFKNNIDQHADGTAAYVSEAIAHYSK